jgi:myosin heavy subunit
MEQVMYQAPGFLDKNRDPLGPLIIGCFKSSTFELLRNLFPEDPNSARAGRNAIKTISAAFRVLTSIPLMQRAMSVD